MFECCTASIVYRGETSRWKARLNSSKRCLGSVLTFWSVCISRQCSGISWSQAINASVLLSFACVAETEEARPPDRKHGLMSLCVSASVGRRQSMYQCPSALLVSQKLKRRVLPIGSSFDLQQAVSRCLSLCAPANQCSRISWSQAVNVCVLHSFACVVEAEETRPPDGKLARSPASGVSSQYRLLNLCVLAGNVTAAVGRRQAMFSSYHLCLCSRS
jgi:hypothetical protein